MRRDNPLVVPVRFLLHVLVGIALFSMVALPELILHHLVEFLASAGLPEQLQTLLRILEFAIIVFDLLACGAYIGFNSYVFLKESCGEKVP
jgi:hypothetical protein